MVVHYACRKCRSILFDADAISHSAGKGPADEGSASTVKTKWGRAAKRVGGGACTSVFLGEVPDWASGLGNDGALNCPTCDVRVGNFSWSGATCSCGRWITPAFQFPLAKIDPKGAVDLSALMRGPSTTAAAPTATPGSSAGSA